jgi:ankyrin repeat protein
MAARQGNVEVIEALLDEGADLEARDTAGETALRRAVNCDKVEAARVLMKRGADAESVGSKGLTVREAVWSARMRGAVADGRG